MEKWCEWQPRRLASERVARSSPLIAARLGVASFPVAHGRINVREDDNIRAVETGRWATASTGNIPVGRERSSTCTHHPAYLRKAAAPNPSTATSLSGGGARNEKRRWRRRSGKNGRSRDEKRRRSHRQPMVTMAQRISLEIATSWVTLHENSSYIVGPDGMIDFTKWLEGTIFLLILYVNFWISTDAGPTGDEYDYTLS